VAVDIALFVPMSISFYMDCKVYTRGHTVNVQLTFIPGKKNSNSDFIKFTLEGKPYDKKIDGNIITDLLRAGGRHPT
jgi:hypothetical protein